MEDLKEKVLEFFSYLDIVETSDEGKEFHPVNITCCRAMLVEKINDCLNNMRELACK